MTSTIYYRMSRAFLVLSLALLIVSIGSAISIFAAEFPMKPSFSHQGFDNFISYFGFSIKALTATLATFAIWLTLERMTQTERQINAIIDNNKFNNYNKQLQDFVEYMIDTALFSAIHKVDETPHRGIIVPLYKIYYAETYEVFRALMKESFKIVIDKFYLDVASSPLAAQNCDLSKISIAEIKKLSGLASGDVRELIVPLTEKVFSRIHSSYITQGLSWDTIQMAQERIQELYVISWTLAFYRSLRVFDGQIDAASGYFQENFERYYTGLGV